MNKKITTIIGTVAGAGLLAASLAACNGNNSGQQQENQQQQQDTTSMEASQPIPHYDWSQIRQTMIDAQDIAASGTQTTSFFFMMGDRDPIFSCPSIGMPVPNTAQLSNPEQVVGTGNNNAVTTPQMDPDGIYSPPTSSGTYVICVNNSGDKYLQYWEGDVMTVAAGAEWNASSHSLSVTGAPTAAIHVKSGK